MKHCNAYIRLMRLDKPVGILLLLWPTLWALWLATQGHPEGVTLSLFMVEVVIMRSAGCIMNDIADRKWDGYVARTRERPLVTGAVSLRRAILLLGVLLLMAYILVLYFNSLTLQLAVVGVLLAGIYPFLKRYTHWPQFGLGLAFAWGVLLAFAAVTDCLAAAAWIVFIPAVVWPMIYDTQYAMVDRLDDQKIGIKSTAILFGTWDRWLIGLFQGLFLLALLMMGAYFHLRYGYYLSLVGVGLLFSYQQYLIYHRFPERCFKAFLNHQWVGACIFLGIVAGLP